MKLMRHFRSGFAKAFISLFTGSAIAQLIPLLLAPFISRTFSVEDVGVFGLYFSLVATLSVVAAGRYEMAVVLPKSKDDATRLVHLSTLVSIAFSVVLLLLVWAFSGHISAWLNNDRITPWLYWVPLAIAIVGIYQALNVWLIREKRFTDSAVNKVAQRVIEGSVIIGTGASGMGSGLVVSDIIGRVGMLFAAYWQAVRQGFSRVSFDWQSMQRLAREYSTYPLSFSASSLANATAMHIPVLFISSAYLAAATGFFNMMKYVLSAPVAFIARNVAQVFMERIAEKWRLGEPVLRDFKRMTLLMLALAAGFTLPILVFGEALFAFFFGPKWNVAGVFAQIMVVSFAARFVVSPLSSLLNGLNKVSIASTWQWFYFVVILSLVPISKLGWEIEWFLWYYSAAETAAYLVYWFLIFSAAKKHDLQRSAAN